MPPADDEADGLRRALADAFSADPGDVDPAMVRLMLVLSHEDPSAPAASSDPRTPKKSVRCFVPGNRWRHAACKLFVKTGNDEMESHGPFAEAKRLIATYGRRARQTLVDRIVAAVRAGDDVEARSQGDLLRQVDAELDNQARFGVKPVDS